MDVSIIVAVYQQSAFLAHVLHALGDQAFAGQYEVIVCDDGSALDHVTRALSQASESQLDIRYVWQPDKGNRVGRSRNNGCRIAQGDILIFVDGDVLVRPNFIFEHVAAHAKGSPLVVGGYRWWVPTRALPPAPNSETLSVCERHATDRDRAVQKSLFRSPLPWMGCWAFNYSVRRSLAPAFDEALTGCWHEDYDLLCRLYHYSGAQIRLTDRLDVFHLYDDVKPDSWNPWTCGRPEVIAGYVMNCLALRDKYPDLDLSLAMWPLKHFRFDEATGEWRRVASVDIQPLALAIERAERWRSSCQ